MAGRARVFDPEIVLDRAMTEFWRRGYEATALSDLERVTGLGRQSSYGAFGDKRALFQQVVERYFERVLKPYVTDVLGAVGSPRENLERIFESWESTARAPDFNGCFVGNAVSELAHDAELAAVLRRKRELMEAAFTRMLRRAQRAGEVRATLDTRGTARSLLVLAQGLALVARVERDRHFVHAVVASARRLLD